MTAIMRRLLIGFCAGLVALFAVAPPLARAEESILSFASTIEAMPSGTLRVTEVIEVRAEGNQIKRGIYRDFPLTFEGADGRLREVGFDIVAVERDGQAEPYSTSYSGDGVRIYIGDADVFLRPGAYSYRLTYETTRQIRFFDDHDEIYWNVTGNEWAFAIDKAVARVVLPQGARATKWTAYTGRYGATGAHWSAREEDGGQSLVFATTRALGVSEGLSVVVALPKGIIAPPTAADEAGYFWLDHRNEILGAGGLLIVLGYYLWAWFRVGRDPEKGIVIPLFSAPDGTSPALSNYIHFKGFSGDGWEALSAACINLAVKGLIVLEDLDGELTLKPLDKKATRLPKGERVVLDVLGSRPLTLSKADGSRVKTLGEKFRAAIESENRGKFFKSNTGYWIVGIVVSVVCLLTLFIFGRLSETDIVLLVPMIGVGILLSVFAVTVGRRVRQARGIARAIQLVFMVFFSGFMLMGLAVTIVPVLLDANGPPLLLIAIAALVAINILFFILLGAPTALGRALMDKVEGLKLYLSVAEAERMNMAGAPTLSPERFETLLPYAVALRVEKPWSEAFQSWLVSAAAAGAAATYAPVWYLGRDFNADNFGRTMSNTVEAMSGAFTSSLPAPKSSSSGFSSGGGFSGGGGGGGGGGGW